LIPPLCANDVA